MTKQELHNTFDQVVEVIKSNETVVGPVLDKADKLVSKIRNQPEMVGAACMLMGLDKDAGTTFLQVAQELINIERILIDGGLGKRITRILHVLQDRPVMMYAIARLL